MNADMRSQLIDDTIYRRYLYIKWLYKRYITREANDQDKPKGPPPYITQ